VRKSPYQNRGQLVLELEPQNCPALVKRSRLVEALADLLLEALGTDEATSTNKEASISTKITRDPKGGVGHPID
jgi:hypothetical protein